MRSVLKIFSLTFLLVVSTRLVGQPTFSIKYHIKLFSGNGNALTCDSLAKDSLFIDSYPGYLIKHEYDASSKSFYIEINTILPKFALIWKRQDKQMIFVIDCPTQYKEIYLDSLYFNQGNFLVHDNCDKYVVSQDKRSRHIVFSDYSKLKQNTDFVPERRGVINTINCN